MRLFEQRRIEAGGFFGLVVEPEKGRDFLADLGHFRFTL